MNIAEAYLIQTKRKKDVSLLKDIMQRKGMTDINYFFAVVNLLRAQDEAAFADAFETMTPDEIARFTVHMFECLVYWWEIDLGD